ncbi:hypothetical protein VP1G_08911 [Cytospora mali]|uniref:Uncharacterized protein n=1 Tax=Cytospora mali TaxID=578113 RepID=A0A194VDD0_CYTMA|nr:hypothetical protein VP1G_08911 [Valsa mali var. pyri (nom. inval.)]
MAPNLSTLLLLSLLTISTHASQEFYHFQKRDYATEVCNPNTTSTTDPLPPCIEIQNIESACTPNGTQQIDYVAHAECMCGGSYFSEWTGCQDCLYFHGQRTEREEAFYESVVSAASHSLCDFLTSSDAGAATPTTDFAAIFSAVEATMTQPTTGGTVSNDQAPGKTAVSLYYTFSGSQGPGAITGSAAEATATATTAASSVTSEASSGSSSSKGGSSKSTTSTGASSKATGTAAGSTTSTGGSAASTGVAGGVLLGLAGLAVAAGL